MLYREDLYAGLPNRRRVVLGHLRNGEQKESHVDQEYGLTSP